jgi:transcriptional regulator with XRE-family HTH domain
MTAANQDEFRQPCRPARALEEMREAKGMRKLDMARVLGVSLPRYCDFCAGRRAVPIAVLKRAFALGVPATELLGDECDSA